jgi:glycosyltransferase involved in cell wall biosynthesis
VVARDGASESRPHGLLRLLVCFHESASLGAGTSILRVVDELAAFGWATSGWFPSDGPLRGARNLAAAYSAERPLAFSRRGWQEAPGLFARLARTPAYVDRVRSALVQARPHVVHANTLLSLPEATVARTLGLPVVLQAHELPPAGRKRATTLRAAALVADVLVGVSDAVSAMLREHAGSTPVLTVRNGVPSSPAARERRDGPFTFGTLGTVSRVKGTDVLLRAAKLVLERRPGVRFEHAGAMDLHRDIGLDDELARLRAEVEQSVSFLGPQAPETTLPSWDVFVLPSRSEAFPLATLEAMAAGIPVVATAVGGVPEQVQHLETGILVPPDDARSLGDWLVRLHDEPELRRRLGEAAARRVRNELTLARQAEGLHRAYLTALNARFAPPFLRRQEPSLS